MPIFGCQTVTSQTKAILQQYGSFNTSLAPKRGISVFESGVLNPSYSCHHDPSPILMDEVLLTVQLLRTGSFFHGLNTAKRTNMPRANSMCFPAGIHHSLIRPGSRQRIGALQERTEGVPSAPQNKRTGTAEYAAGKSWRVSSHVSLRRDYGTAVRVSGVAHTEPTMDFRLSQN
jgi:hypothetical protein